MFTNTMYTGDIAPLIDWLNHSNERVPEPYFSWLREQMPEGCRARLIHRVGTITPNYPVNGKWVKGYPHIHTKTMGWNPEVYTIITYVITPEEGGEFAIGGLNEDDPYTIIKVEPGLSVGCDSITWHGVLPVRKGLRTAIVSAGFPE